MHTLVDFFRQFDPMEWLTIGLVIFAGAQVLVTERHGVQRRVQRKEDEARVRAEMERRADQDYQLVHAEWLRLEALASDWSKLDLVESTAMGALDHTHLLPSDWWTVMSALSRTGVEAGHLGVMAITHGQDVARAVLRLTKVIEVIRVRHPELTPDALSAEARRNLPWLGKYEADIKFGVLELARAMQDAVNQSPRASIERDLLFRGELVSDMGKDFARTIMEIKRRNSARSDSNTDTAG